MDRSTARFEVIDGGKGKTRPEYGSGPGFLLYRAYSVMDFLEEETVYHDVRVNWYVLERKEPVAPYGDMIADYHELDERSRLILEADVNRYLTETEVKALYAYLQEQRGLDLFVNPVNLPVSDRGAMFIPGKPVVYDFFQLSEEENYDLPFKVWGYYSLAGAMTSPLLKNGVVFLRRALEILGIQSNADDVLLEATVKALHRKDGLIVRRSGD
jgi:hypothetical protein